MAWQPARGKLLLARLWVLPLRAAAARYVTGGQIAADTDWWIDCIDDVGLSALDHADRFAYLVGALPEFRSLFHARLRGTAAPTPLRWLLRRAYPPESTLRIDVGTLGPALFIQHGVSTFIVADAIGSHCWINQQVTIGHNAVGRPTVGDRVRIGAGAVVFGAITLHDDCTVGANATVMHDVPAGVTMVAPLAVPAPQPPET